MYSHHFGLSQDPFSIAPDPRYLFMSERHREALAHLLYGVAGVSGAAGGFVLLTGDIGTGKTTVCRCFLEQIPTGCHVAYIFNPKLTVAELLQSICDEFHIAVPKLESIAPTVKNYIDTLNAFLLHSHAAGQSCVLIIDEAQNLSADVLEQLRLLTNLETNERKLLQIVLIGQPELRTMLKRPELEQLAQRVIARFHLDALSKSETRHYIEHRLAVAGHTGALPFDEPALQTIYRLARGVPRRINLLCGRALLGAWASGQNRVNRRIVHKAATEVFGPETVPAGHALTGSRGYWLGALGLLGGAVLTSLILWPARIPPPRPVALTPPAPLPMVAAVTPAAPPPQVPAPLETLEDLLPQLTADLTQAWRDLGPLWKLGATDGDPCSTLPPRTLALQCYRVSNLTLPMIRQLSQPGILTLQDGAAPPVYALLTGLTDQNATLRLADRLHTVRLVSLGRLWRGDFATYWRQPPGYSADLRDGSSGPVIDRLARQLTLLDGAPATNAASAPTTLDPALRGRVRAFQRAQGLKADGQPGPMTFMQLDSATGMTEPRLQTVSP
jgi:general secretion pathway protein A